ncbi:MAG: flagellar hook-basal body protein [Deltaproteobacteria bacterium]|nr:flagellar hook-basal body protein [Deltaproteobacteria bacterium]
MSDGIWSALSGAVGQLTALDIAANNVANVSTPGYRADHLVFREVLGKATAAKGRPSPGMNYSSVGNVLADQSQGTVVQTGRPLDTAIRGNGYFVISTPRGERYTRMGSFEVARDGTLTTREGAPLIGVDLRRIKLPQGATDVRIGADGTVQVAGQPSGQLLTVSFPGKSPLEKEGAVLFRRAQGAAAPVPTPAILEPGALEQSNMSAVTGMMDIVGASRSFDACQRVIDAFRDADRRAAMNIAAKV